MERLSLLVLALLHAKSAAASPTLQLKLRCERTCVTRDAILRVLRTTNADAGLSRIALRCEAQQATVQLSNPSGQRSTRTFALAPQDCRALPQTVALLARGWSPRRFEPSVERPAPQAVASTVRPLAAREAVTPRARRDEAPAPPPSPAPVSRAPPASVQTTPPAPEVAGDEPPKGAAEPPSPTLRPQASAGLPPTTVAAATWGGGLTVMGFGTASVAPLLPWGALRLEGVAWRRWGVAVSAGLGGTQGWDRAPGQVSGWRLQLLAGLIASLRPVTEAGPRLVLQAGAERMAASATGFSENRSTAGWGALIQGTAEWNQPLWRGFVVRAGAGAVIRPAPWSLQIRNLGEVARVEVVEAVGVVGLGWHWEL